VPSRGASVAALLRPGAPASGAAGIWLDSHHGARASPLVGTMRIPRL